MFLVFFGSFFVWFLAGFNMGLHPVLTWVLHPVGHVNHGHMLWWSATALSHLISQKFEKVFNVNKYNNIMLYYSVSLLKIFDHFLALNYLIHSELHQIKIDENRLIF